jgi:hypothetical protein
MPLILGQELTLDFELKPAGVQESLTVIGVAPALDMTSARIGVNVSEREVNNLPVNGRQMSQLMLQAPGSQSAVANPAGTLPLVLPASSTTEANKLQPGQAYTVAAAGAFDQMTSTVNKTVGLGTQRQVQLALRLNF